MIGFQCPQQSQVGTMRAPTSSEQANSTSVQVLTSLSSHMNLISHQSKVHSTSPGYQSAASSPTSSVASPVSSSSGCSMSAAGNSNSAANSSAASPSSSRSPNSVGLLEYYPQLNGDPLGLSWARQVNNRTALGAALMSDKMIVCGDISLAEMSRYPVPIMARPPLGVSDITLENWIQELAQAQPERGIKLTFSSTRTVEPAFRVLARHAQQLKGPLILSADILAPQTSSSQQANNGRSSRQLNQHSQQPVDAWTFLMLCRTRFPKCIISIGWSSQEQLSMESSSSCSLHSSADSMFELDILDSHNQTNHLAHLQHQHHKLHQQLHPYPLVSRASSQQQQHQSMGHHILSSSGSLNSSSGNSSGSPSPTSPINQLMSPAHQMNASLGLGLNSTDLFLAGQKSAAATAAAMAAAVVAASAFQQSPLNLNINEANEQLSSSVNKIQSYQTISNQQQQHNLSQAQADRLMVGQKRHSPSQSSNSSSPKQLRADQQQTNNSQLLLKTANQQQSGGYTRDMIDKMATLVKEYNLSQPVTFPVEARLMRNSLAELQRLLYQVGANSTLTVMAQPEDLITVDELLTIRRAFAANQLLFELPDQLNAALRHELDLL